VKNGGGWGGGGFFCFPVSIQKLTISIFIILTILITENMKFELLNDDCLIKAQNRRGGSPSNKNSEAHFCSECFQVFPSKEQIKFFCDHSCINDVIGHVLPVSHNLFYEHCCSIKESLTLTQSKLVRFLLQSCEVAVEDEKQLILLLLGGIGCGRSRTFNAAITMFYATFDSESFCVLHPTKTGASLLNCSTLSAFLGLEMWADGELDDGKVHATSGLSISQLASIRLVRTIFLEDFGLLSKHHHDFLNTFLKAVHDSDKFFGGVNVIFCGDYWKCELLTQTCLLQSSDCFLFNLSERKTFCSILNHMRDNTSTSEMVEEINGMWGSVVVGNKRVSFLLMCILLITMVFIVFLNLFQINEEDQNELQSKAKRPC
jgi:hypothetical protein